MTDSRSGMTLAIADFLSSVNELLSFADPPMKPLEKDVSTFQWHIFSMIRSMRYTNEKKDAIPPYFLGKI